MSESSIEESINLGAISEAINDKMDRDAQNAEISVTQTSGADLVVEWKAPTDSDKTWYRLYASGWVEQGGQTAEGTSITVNLLKTMANNYYNVQLTCINKSQGDQNWVATSKTTASFLYSNSESFAVNWEVKGMVAR